MYHIRRYLVATKNSARVRSQRLWLHGSFCDSCSFEGIDHLLFIAEYKINKMKRANVEAQGPSSYYGKKSRKEDISLPWKLFVEANDTRSWESLRKSKYAKMVEMEASEDFACVSVDVRKGSKVKVYYLDGNPMIVFDIVVNDNVALSSNDMFPREDNPNIIPGLFWPYPPLPYSSLPLKSMEELKSSLDIPIPSYSDPLRYAIRLYQTSLFKYAKFADVALLRETSLLLQATHTTAKFRLGDFYNDRFERLSVGISHFLYWDKFQPRDTVIRIPAPEHYADPRIWREDVFGYAVNRYLGREMVHVVEIRSKPVVAYLPLEDGTLGRMLGVQEEHLPVSLEGYMKAVGKKVGTLYAIPKAMESKLMHMAVLMTVAGVIHGKLTARNIRVRETESESGTYELAPVVTELWRCYFIDKKQGAKLLGIPESFMPEKFIDEVTKCPNSLLVNNPLFIATHNAAQIEVMLSRDVDVVLSRTGKRPAVNYGMDLRRPPAFSMYRAHEDCDSKRNRQNRRTIT